MTRLVVLALACCLSLPWNALDAQGRLPKRPRLRAPADTNDARAYYDRGMELLERDPGNAADAFYWASRLDPAWAEAFYARRVAGFMVRDRVMVRYFNGIRSAVLSKEAQALDSLEYRALALNPFFLRDLERAFVYAYIVADVNDMLRSSGQQPLDASQRVELDFYIQGFLDRGVNLWARARFAAAERRFSQALDLYRRALTDSRQKAGILADRAQVFYVSGAADSALAQLQEAIAELRTRDDDRLVRIYESKELFEHQIGMIHEQREDRAAAREAYGRALQENLSFYPAHMRLALVALAAGDTTQAVSELDLALQVAPKEVTVLVTYGAILAQVGRAEQADTLLRRAIELEPFYAVPHYLLGQVAEARRNKEQAVAAYQAFLARASRADKRRADVTQRVADLGQN